MKETIHVARCVKGAYTLVHDRNEYWDGWHDEARIERTLEDGKMVVTQILLPIKASSYTEDSPIAPVVSDYTDEEYEAILDKEIAEFEA